MRVIQWDTVNGIMEIASLSHVDFGGETCEISCESIVKSELKEDGFGFAEISEELFNELDEKYGIKKIK